MTIKTPAVETVKIHNDRTMSIAGNADAFVAIINLAHRGDAEDSMNLDTATELQLLLEVELPPVISTLAPSPTNHEEDSYTSDTYEVI